MRPLILASGLLAAALAVGGLYWMSRAPSPPAVDEVGVAPTPGVPWFEDVTAASGIDFWHFDSSTPDYHIQEVMGGGVAWIDYDGDGLLDLYFVKSGQLRPKD